MNRLGYCCISVGINHGLKKKDQILVNRGMIKKTFQSKGLDYVSELIMLNLNDTLKILEYNVNKDIFVYRMSSDSFPWMSEYTFEDLPKFNIIKEKLINIGNFIKDNNIRVSFHPSHFCILASERDEVVTKAIDELNKHAELMDLMQLDRSTYYPINIHVGTSKPTLVDAANKFCSKFQLLSESCKSRLTVENDDSPNMFSTKMLYDLIYIKIGIPIVFDQHHFMYGPQDISMEDSLKLAISTWKTKPLIHMSSSKFLEDGKSVKTAHADYIYEKIQDFGLEFDCEIEAKAKDLAVIRYRDNQNKL